MLCWNREQTEALYVRSLVTSSVVGFPFPELPSGLEETPVDTGLAKQTGREPPSTIKHVEKQMEKKSLSVPALANLLPPRKGKFLGLGKKKKKKKEHLASFAAKCRAKNTLLGAIRELWSGRAGRGRELGGRVGRGGSHQDQTNLAGHRARAISRE